MSDQAMKRGDTDFIDVELISDHAASWTLDGTVRLTVKTPRGRKIVDEGVCTITDPVKHYVRYIPTVGEMTQPPGEYNCEWRNVDSQGVTRRFPTGKDDADDYYVLQITQNLD